MKKILLVNPWIYDFAAYDLWVKPWGLLKIASILKNAGHKTFLVDVLDRHHPLISEEDIHDHADGTGKYISEEVSTPEPFKNIPRKYKRYGLYPRLLPETLPENVDAVLVSSGMTYWYPGAFEAIKMIREKYDDVPIILGGVYATLSYDHAVLNSGADHVVSNADLQSLSSLLDVECDLSFRAILDAGIDYSGYREPGYGVLRLSIGCPFDCAYCAQKRLGPAFMVKDIEKAVTELKDLYARGIKNFAFYDDALLFDTEYIKDYLKRILSEGITAHFYTPNGLHARFITEEIAYLMKKTGFIKPILSLETSEDEKGKDWHNKVNRSEFKKAVSNLQKAGYTPGEYMVYLMLGIPGSDMEDTESSIDFVHSLGAEISLSEFSPVAGAKMSEQFPEAIEEPLLQNNSAFPSFSLSEWPQVQSIKNKARRLNASLKNQHNNRTLSTT